MTYKHPHLRGKVHARQPYSSSSNTCVAQIPVTPRLHDALLFFFAGQLFVLARQQDSSVNNAHSLWPLKQVESW